MDRSQRMYKLGNGTDTAVWAANEIERITKDNERLRALLQEVVDMWDGPLYVTNMCTLVLRLKKELKK